MEAEDARAEEGMSRGPGRGAMTEQGQEKPGGAGIGFLCSYTPIEILLAGGFRPVRIGGHSGGIRKADGLMHPNMCQYVRACLDQAVEGAYGSLKGVVFVNACDAMRRLADVWAKYADTGFVHVVDLPKGRTPADIEYMRNEFSKLRTALERGFGTGIEDDALREAVRVLNRSRSLFHELNKLRCMDPPRLTGSEAMQLIDSIHRVTPEPWNRTVEALIAEKQEGIPEGTNRPRVVLAGSPMHNPEVVAFIEDCGFHVVYEDVCTGSRFFDVRVGNDQDPLTEMAKAYLEKPPCARMMMMDERADGIVRRAGEFNAVGVVHHALKFCDTVLYDVPELRKRLQAEGLKTLFLEGDGTLGSMGQLKTRLEAFAEVLGDG